METAALIMQGRDDYSASEPVAGALPLLRIFHTFKCAGIKRVAIAGEEYAMNEAFNRATKLGAEFIHETRSKRKMASYRANAIAYLSDKCDRLFIAPAYYPLFEISTVRKMAETEALLAAPVFKGERGYPVLVSKEHFSAMIRTDGDFDRLFEENAWEGVEVDDEGVTADATTPIDAERIAAKLALWQEVRPDFKLTLRREAPFFGPGIMEMIRLVEETGSLKQAFTLMGMSGSHGRRLIADTEAGLGFSIFDNNGSKYYGSSVSREAKAYAARYKAFYEDCASYVDEAYKRHFE